jgi:Protein of unknown function (DUF1549)/Protein of unknown function (DUF1553)
MSTYFRGYHDNRVEPVLRPLPRWTRLFGAGLSSLFLLAALSPCRSLSADKPDQPDKPVRKSAAAAKDRPLEKNRRPDNIHRSSDPVVAFIDQEIQRAWAENDVTPSPMADDEEWLRRVSLDLYGHIPPWKEIDHFRKDKNPTKRSALVDKMLDDPEYVRNWTTIWTNLTIGRQTPRRVSRPGIQKFFRESFAQNRPWNEIVYDLVSAEGRSDENGAVNYLLAQMTTNDELVQATAKTTRLFMGVQLQCAQCHNHPFDPWKQDQFWQLNSFLRQTRPVEHRKFDQATGRRITDYTELVRTGFSGPVYFEKRSGEMQVAYPIFFDKKIDPGSEINRRKELARLMTTGDKPYIAQAMANRAWGHFFGYGFSNPVDDIGARHPPSHPELLDRLSQEFARNHFDVKGLIRWICNSEAYQLTSKTTKKNAKDDPALGRAPLFSRVYPKPMEAEQLYDSLLIATEADHAGKTDWSARQKQRDEWLQQFIIAFGTDENDEATTFNGTIPQALLMMNGQLIEKATSAEPGSFLHRVLDSDSSDSRKITRLYLAALSRHPHGREQGAAEHLLEMYPDRLPGYQDLFWALLNSNEFIINH